MAWLRSPMYRWSSLYDRVLSTLHGEYGLPIICSTHPRTRQKLDTLGEALPEGVRFEKPFGYHDYNRLQLDAKCTLSDSGTISEESSMLGFPAVTVRTAIERPEALDTGHIVLTGLDPDRVLDAVDLAIATHDDLGQYPIPTDYQIKSTSLRVVKLICGLTKLAHRWDGIVTNEQ